MMSKASRKKQQKLNKFLKKTMPFRKKSKNRRSQSVNKSKRMSHLSVLKSNAANFPVINEVIDLDNDQENDIFNMNVQRNRCSRTTAKADSSCEIIDLDNVSINETDSQATSVEVSKQRRKSKRALNNAARKMRKRARKDSKKKLTSPTRRSSREHSYLSETLSCQTLSTLASVDHLSNSKRNELVQHIGRIIRYPIRRRNKKQEIQIYRQSSNGNLNESNNVGALYICQNPTLSIQNQAPFNQNELNIVLNPQCQSLQPQSQATSLNAPQSLNANSSLMVTIENKDAASCSESRRSVRKVFLQDHTSLSEAPLPKHHQTLQSSSGCPLEMVDNNCAPSLFNGGNSLQKVRLRGTSQIANNICQIFRNINSSVTSPVIGQNELNLADNKELFSPDPVGQRNYSAELPPIDEVDVHLSQAETEAANLISNINNMESLNLNIATTAQETSPNNTSNLDQSVVINVDATNEVEVQADTSGDTHEPNEDDCEEEDDDDVVIIDEPGSSPINKRTLADGDTAMLPPQKKLKKDDDVIVIDDDEVITIPDAPKFNIKKKKRKNKKVTTSIVSISPSRQTQMVVENARINGSGMITSTPERNASTSNQPDCGDVCFCRSRDHNVMEWLTKNEWARSCNCNKSVYSGCSKKMDRNDEFQNANDENLVPAPTIDSIKSKFGSNIYNPNAVIKKGLRTIVIDGSNVSLGHTNGRYFSVKGLKICIDYFRAMGHTVRAFVPHYRLNSNESSDPQLLRSLGKEGVVIFTPSRVVQGRRIVPYDDRFIVQYAAACDGVIVSNDNYRDVMKENPTLRPTIEQRLLMYTWVDDMIIFPPDPLGQFGPTFDEYLRFP